ncbi:MAG: hypothetical protein HYW10_05495 [Candidatus Omnitrophica bacterium]|nr:hypothetical protein [Candidatus Omnitrophota bacterium]
MRVGIIDVGTNSIHLLIGEVGRHGSFRVILKARDLTRLGDEGLVEGSLTPAATRRATSILQRYAAILKRRRVDHVEAVATSAVREAKNGRAFVRRVRSRLGLPPRFHLGAPIVWVGGGSAQVIHGSGSRPGYLTSLPLGAARLTQRFIRHDPPQPDEIEALRRYARRAWAPVVRAIRRRSWRHSLGGSSMTRELALAAYGLQCRQPPAEERRLSINRRSLHRLVDWLFTSTARERSRLAGVDPRRQDLLLAAGIVLLTWMEGCRVARLRYAPGSLREGLIFNKIAPLARLAVDEARRPG